MWLQYVVLGLVVLWILGLHTFAIVWVYQMIKSLVQLVRGRSAPHTSVVSFTSSAE